VKCRNAFLPHLNGFLDFDILMIGVLTVLKFEGMGKCLLVTIDSIDEWLIRMVWG